MAVTKGAAAAAAETAERAAAAARTRAAATATAVTEVREVCGMLWRLATSHPFPRTPLLVALALGRLPILAVLTSPNLPVPLVPRRRRGRGRTRGLWGWRWQLMGCRYCEAPLRSSGPPRNLWASSTVLPLSLQFLPLFPAHLRILLALFTPQALPPRLRRPRPPQSSQPLPPRPRRPLPRREPDPQAASPRRISRARWQPSRTPCRSSGPPSCR